MRDDRILWYVSSKRWTFGLVSERGIVTEAAPISEWAIGQPLGKVLTWWRSKGADRIERVDRKERQERQNGKQHRDRV